MSFAERPLLNRALIVCSLGYFIDVLDIQLFAVLRVPSLRDLGVDADHISSVASHLLTFQMIGMILGMFLWGWIGDRFGRLKALYGSIIVYSIGSFACGFVGDVPTYGFLRLLTGVGLSGETGVAITLIAEMMTPKMRGWGIVGISAFGFLGPVVAVLISKWLPWRDTYILAGVIGLLILVLRLRLAEPALFLKNQGVRRFSVRSLTKRRLLIFLACVLIGVPINYAWNILNFFSVEFSSAVLQKGSVFDQKTSLLLFYLGTSVGDVISGALSQFLRSRRASMAIFLALLAVIACGLLGFAPRFRISVGLFYTMYFALGIAGGAWMLFSMIASEHFGTDVRASASVGVVNLVRGSTVLLVPAFQGLRGLFSITDAALFLGLMLLPLGFLALFAVDETFGGDLDYLEAPPPLST